MAMKPSRPRARVIAEWQIQLPASFVNHPIDAGDEGERGENGCDTIVERFSSLIHGDCRCWRCRHRKRHRKPGGRAVFVFFSKIKRTCAPYPQTRRASGPSNRWFMAAVRIRILMAQGLRLMVDSAQTDPGLIRAGQQNFGWDRAQGILLQRSEQTRRTAQGSERAHRASHDQKVENIVEILRLGGGVRLASQRVSWGKDSCLAPLRPDQEVGQQQQGPPVSLIQLGGGFGHQAGGFTTRPHRPRIDAGALGRVESGGPVSWGRYPSCRNIWRNQGRISQSLERTQSDPPLAIRGSELVACRSSWILNHAPGFKTQDREPGWGPLRHGTNS